MCAVDDADGWEVYSETWRKAAKEHRCCECRRTIAVGERYRRASAMYDGYWSDYKTCAHCEAAGGWLVAMCGGWLVEGLDEELAEHWDEYGTLGLGRIMVARRRRWQGTTPEQITTWADDSVRRIRALVAA